VLISRRCFLSIGVSQSFAFLALPHEGATQMLDPGDPNRSDASPGSSTSTRSKDFTALVPQPIGFQVIGLSTRCTRLVGRLQDDVPIALTEAAPNAAASVPVVDVRRQGRHHAIIIVTRGARPGLCPSNADDFLHPFGPPVFQVSSEEGAWLGDRAQQGVDAVVVAEIKRTPA
jgi:hypothetical protein